MLPAGATVRCSRLPRRPQETLVEAARFFGPVAVAKCEGLTVRKLYHREFHFFDGENGGWEAEVARMGAEAAAPAPALQHCR